MTRLLTAIAVAAVAAAGPALAHGDHAPVAEPAHGLIHLLPGSGASAALLALGLALAAVAALGLRAPRRRN